MVNVLSICRVAGCGQVSGTMLVPFCTDHRLMIDRNTLALIRRVGALAASHEDPATRTHCTEQHDAYVHMAASRIADMEEAVLPRIRRMTAREAADMAATAFDLAKNPKTNRTRSDG